jgi:hypothetical protein
MRRWPDVDPGDVNCPAMLLVGTKNKPTLAWLETNRSVLDRAGVRTKIVEGLTHDQEFTKIDRVFPAVSSFLLQERSL